MKIVTCVYCGHRYPEGTPPHGAKILTEHIRVCKKHPMRKLEIENVKLRKIIEKLHAKLEATAEELGWLTSQV